MNLDQSQSELCDLFESELALAIPRDYQINKKTRLLREHAVNYLQEIYGQCQIHDTLVPYVAMNIFDRINSKHQSLIHHKNIDLFVICCFIISCKMKIKSFRARTFLLEKQMKYSLSEVVLTERRILKSLEWMIDPNPFCFVKYFLPLLQPSQTLRHPHVSQIIVWSQADIRFTQFRPSTLAAAAILCVFPEPHFTKCIAYSTDCESLDMEELTNCTRMMKTKYREKLKSWRAKPSATAEKPSTSTPTQLAHIVGCEKKILLEDDNHSTIVCEETEMAFELEWMTEPRRVDSFTLSESFCKIWSWVTTYFLEALYHLRPEREDGHILRAWAMSPTTSQQHQAPRLGHEDDYVLSEEDSPRTHQPHEDDASTLLSFQFD